MMGLPRSVWVWQLAFAALSAILLWRPPLAYGWLVLGLVMLWHLGTCVSHALAGDRVGHRLWLFLLPLSVMMVLPDWWLSAGAGVLRFPNHGIPQAGPVPVYMALMWSIPLYLIVRLAGLGRGAAWRGAGLALLIFGLAEALAPTLQLWAPQNVTGIGGLALYILLPEAWLGAASVLAWRLGAGQGLGAQVGVAAGVMLSYLGAAALSLLLLEPVLRAAVG